MTQTMKDMDRLSGAFTEFRAMGYWARMNQQDGWAAVPIDVIKRTGKVVFWHANETRHAFDEDGNLRLNGIVHLQHLTRDAEEIARILKQHGLTTWFDENGNLVLTSARHERRA